MMTGMTICRLRGRQDLADLNVFGVFQGFAPEPLTDLVEGAEDESVGHFAGQPELSGDPGQGLGPTGFLDKKERSGGQLQALDQALFRVFQ